MENNFLIKKIEPSNFLQISYKNEPQMFLTKKLSLKLYKSYKIVSEISLQVFL